MHEDVFVGGRIGVEIVGRTTHPGNVCSAMRAEERFFGGQIRRTPFPIRMGFAQMCRTAHDPRRTLGMSRRAIFSALWIVKENQPALALHEAAEVRPIARDQENLKHRDDEARHDFFCSRSHENVKEQNVYNDRRKNG